MDRDATNGDQCVDENQQTAHEADALWNLERLCRRKALEGLPPITDRQHLFLNIEPDSVHDPELRDLPFQDLLEGVGLSPSQVVLEITEHSAAAAAETTGERFCLRDAARGGAGGYPPGIVKSWA